MAAFNTIDLDGIEKYKKDLDEISRQTRMLSTKISKVFEAFSIDSPILTQKKEELASRNMDFSKKCESVSMDLSNRIEASRKSIASSEEDASKTLGK